MRNDDLNKHISVWVPAPPVTQNTIARRRLQQAASRNTGTTVPPRWTPPVITRRRAA